MKKLSKKLVKKLVKKSSKNLIKNKNINVKKCSTIEPDIDTKKKIQQELSNIRAIDNNETMHIGVIYHVCYPNYNKTSVDLDITHVTSVLNKDFNKNADNFDNGRNIYTYGRRPTQKFYRLLKYRRRYRYIRLTRRVRRNRRRFRRALRINRRRRRLNIRANRINRRRRRINRKRIRRNRILRRRLNRLLRIYRNNNNSIISNKIRYEDYVKLADTCNIQFHHIQTIYNPLPIISSNNLNTIDQTVKINGSVAIQSDKYLNVWIVNFNNGLLGYAQFPWDNNVNTDGVVIAHNAFGRSSAYSNYNLNKTMIHEVGHWLGLYHNFQTSFSGQEGIFDNNNDNSISFGERTGDLVNDTPPQTQPTWNNPYVNKKAWPSSYFLGNRYYHMFMNYMDYSYDINLFMFTREQSSKVRMMLNHYRTNYLLNPNEL